MKIIIEEFNRFCYLCKAYYYYYYYYIAIIIIISALCNGAVTC
jgi:hypothetical protein